MTKTEKQERQEEAIAQLRKMLPPGSTVWTELAHVSRSGMLRLIRVHAIADGKAIANITAQVAWATGDKLRDDSGRWTIPIGGCGFDAGFEVVYGLGRALYRDEFTCAGERCPSNDHSNGDRDHSPHKHSDPGYALYHKWL
jgi:hypothetical protein